MSTKNKDYTSYVNTNIGTYGHLLSACSPAVQSPHGAVQIAPIFAPGVVDYYTSDKIYGFKAGSAIVMPTNQSTSMDFYENASGFDHDLEQAKPHYYQVWLEDSDITSSHTAYKNYGAFEFHFSDSTNAFVMLYVKSGTEYKINGNSIYVKGIGLQATCYTRFDFEAIESIEQTDTQTPQSYNPKILDNTLTFKIKLNTEKATVFFASSMISFDKCDETYTKSVSTKTFSDIQNTCKNEWNQLFSKIDVTGIDESNKTVFYTSFYRSMARMHNYSENGEYLGYDKLVHQDNGNEFYCDDGIWDTYRCAHPLQLLVEPKVHQDIVVSYLRMYEQSGWLPRFPYMNGNIPCMLGHHTVSLLADSLAKGIEFDVELAYEAAYKNATKRTMLPWKDGEADELTKCYYEKGFFPGLDENEQETFKGVHEFENRQAVAVTLEHAYDDWCLAQIANHLGKTEDTEYFLKRSKNYLNVFNKETGFVHPKMENGEFTKEYNPKLCGGQGGRKYFAENNAYIYNFNVQHDINGMVEMYGGKDKFIKKLDNLFIEQYEVPKYYFLKQFPDATGLIGQYCHGNEPSFHIPYLYNYVGQAYKTQKKIHDIVKLWYTDHPLGVCGDEDGGAMCSWFVFSAMGFYPVCPGSNEYAIGSPIFDTITINLDNGKTFTVKADGASQKCKYIQAATLNGKSLEKPFLMHEDIVNGGELVLTMGEKPNKELWA
ncbi:GH92 family glycosyl hydrolase [Paludicola sp. MB14-C6]|uniref:GH92 family glycosyl hydrolase n=1 Tax=Paludihabitans sp. MB14-C6 TaxID=3070656 RepID=UPI0027DD7084|nr:GH92 family glycosyl hydrolase [Paludicola sp. MB14-C6]WMJ24017.1 GH92 family glycosyl hydrolase [Paludicola sp. MB14-C6]